MRLAAQAGQRHARWLPPLDDSVESLPRSDQEGVTVLPLFPLGATSFLPHSSHKLRVYEPRYRQLYDDVLFSGSRRFVVTNLDPETRRFAEVGVVFYIKDLTDASDRTQDRVKYVGDHEVIGRVRLGRVLNPGAWRDGSTYLRVETLPVEDTDDGWDHGEQEEALMRDLRELLRLQRGEPLRFSERVVRQFDASRAERGGLWGLAGIWFEYFGSRIAWRQQMMEKDVAAAIRRFLAERPEELPKGAVSLSGLPASLRGEIALLQEHFGQDLEHIYREQAEALQLLLQSTSHGERLEIFSQLIRTEQRRFSAQRALRQALRTNEEGVQ